MDINLCCSSGVGGRTLSGQKLAVGHCFLGAKFGSSLAWRSYAKLCVWLSAAVTLCVCVVCSQEGCATLSTLEHGV